MKFGKTVVAVLAEFPEEIRENCLSYSLWKKRAHDPKILTAVSWKIRLARDCGRLDTFLKSKQGVFDAQLLERVAVINTDILYKARPAFMMHRSLLLRARLCFHSSPCRVHVRLVVQRRDTCLRPLSTLLLLRQLPRSSASGCRSGRACRPWSTTGSCSEHDDTPSPAARRGRCCQSRTATVRRWRSGGSARGLRTGATPRAPLERPRGAAAARREPERAEVGAATARGCCCWRLPPPAATRPAATFPALCGTRWARASSPRR